MSEMVIDPPSDSNAQPPSHIPANPDSYTHVPSYLLTHSSTPLQAPSQLLSQPRSALESVLQSAAREATQSLLGHLLTTTTITSTSDSLTMALPPANPPLLPRWKPLPKPKAPTKWETFARKKGIGKYAANAGGAKLEERRKNLVWDEEKQDWVKKWGYKGTGMQAGQEWLVELDDKQVKKEKEGAVEGKSIRGEPKRERMERIRRQERKERNNQRKNRAGG